MVALVPFLLHFSLGEIIMFWNSVVCLVYVASLPLERYPSVFAQLLGCEHHTLIEQTAKARLLVATHRLLSLRLLILKGHHADLLMRFSSRLPQSLVHTYRASARVL